MIDPLRVWREKIVIIFDAQECYAQEKSQAAKHNPEEVILDSGSTISFFKDAFLVTNIRRVKHKVMTYTNTGDMIVDKEADVPGYVKLFYNEKAITNFFL